MRWLSLLANTRQKTLLKINKLVKDIERKDLSEGLGKLEPLRYRKGWIWRIDENGNILIASCRGHYEYEGADLVWHLSVHRKPRDSLVVFYIQKNEGYRNQVPNSPQNCLSTQLLIQTHGLFYFFKACESINKFYITVRKYATPSKNFKFTPPFLSNRLIIQQHCFFLRIVLTPRLSFHFLWRSSNG